MSISSGAERRYSIRNRPTVPTAERARNQEALWAVNFALGIEDPVLFDDEDADQGVQGEPANWRTWFHPFESPQEMWLGLGIVAAGVAGGDGGLGEDVWGAWRGLVEAGEEGGEHKENIGPAEGDAVGNASAIRPFAHGAYVSPYATPLNDRPEGPLGASNRYASPSASFSENVEKGQKDSDKARVNLSFRTKTQFYSLLDRIERSSFAGAMFLEAYAEHVRRDLCRECWFKAFVSDVGEDSEDDWGENEAVRTKR
ncbi:hypothetical protein BDY21DRAFT_370916 [Lineolata rhizophorae]|uniref:Uncharacterized protein n=1 Tax=Lineolata rhizophorae TaxID=578093 RepID=A0A6A6P4M7_9PEZI|nr:hypothetical protein BDY21DRAFT_370916 [Lineolata rhizophorae]